MARARLDLVKAREIRAWWTQNVGRFHRGEIGVRDLRREVGEMYGVGDKTIQNVLVHNTHREPQK